MRIPCSITGRLSLLVLALAIPSRIDVAKAAGKTCEISVSGAGWPNRVPTMAFFVELKRQERETPLSPRNVYGSVYRANMLDDALLRRLMAETDRVSIVRHTEMYDLDRQPLAKVQAPLYPTSSDCGGDLVLTKIYGIVPNPRRNPYGVAGQLLAGKGRLISEFWFRYRPSDSAEAIVYKGKVVSALPASAGVVKADNPDPDGSVAKASNDNLRQFVEQLLGRRK